MFNIKNISLNGFIPKYINKRNLRKITTSGKYQIVQILTERMWKEGHIIFSVRIDPRTFKEEYPTKLDKSKNIVLYGEKHSMARYYRMLMADKYNVYLVK